jgi:N4-gp56 family major capsid protein
MAITLTTDRASEYRVYMERALLAHAKRRLKKFDLAQQANLPLNEGSTQVRWFQPKVVNEADVLTLAEGVTPAGTPNSHTFNSVTATLDEYGDWVGITDVVNYTEFNKTSTDVSRRFGEEAALKIDAKLRDAAAVLASGFARYYTDVADFAALVAATPPVGTFNVDQLLDAATALKAKFAPLYGSGAYAAVVPGVFTRDLFIQSHDLFVLPSAYGEADRIWNGEIGKLFGIRVVEDDNPMRETTEGTYSATGTIYSATVVGEDAYGVAALSGFSPLSPKVTILNEADKSDPFNQRILFTFKMFTQGVVLCRDFGITVKAKTAWALPTGA